MKGPLPALPPKRRRAWLLPACRTPARQRAEPTRPYLYAAVSLHPSGSGESKNGRIRGGRPRELCRFLRVRGGSRLPKAPTMGRSDEMPIPGGPSDDRIPAALRSTAQEGWNASAGHLPVADQFPNRKGLMIRWAARVLTVTAAAHCEACARPRRTLSCP